METILTLAPVGPQGLLVSMVFWIIIYYVGKIISSLLVPGVYGNLTKPKRDEWDNYVMAWFHATISFWGAYQGVKEYLPGVPENLWWSSTPFQQFVVQFTLAYVLVDTVFVLIKWETIGGWAMLIHHFIFPFSYGLGLYYLKPAFGMYCMLVLQLCEISTPFLHFRWFLSMSGLRHSTLYVVNALTLSALFLAVRGGLMTVMLYRIFSTVDNPVYWPGCPACTVAMNCAWAFQALQYMWCVKVVTGVTAVLFGKGKKDAIEAEGERVHKEKLQSPIAASPKPATDKKEQ